MRLSNADEVLFRQIHPSGLNAGCPCSACFLPSKVDNALLSVDRSALTSAEEAHARFTRQGRQSAAVFGLSVAEFLSCGVPCFEDPVRDHPSLPGNPAHAVGDFSAQSQSSRRVTAKQLKRLAVSRGQLLRVESDDQAAA